MCSDNDIPINGMNPNCLVEVHRKQCCALSVTAKVRSDIVRLRRFFPPSRVNVSFSSLYRWRYVEILAILLHNQLLYYLMITLSESQIQVLTSYLTTHSKH